MDMKPGSMGCPLPGIDAAIVKREPHNAALEIIEQPNVPGELALAQG